MGTCKFTILFSDPFWIGLYEREEETGYSVCKITFGREPRDQEVYVFLLTRWHTLQFTPTLHASLSLTSPANPKRRQREARRQTQATAGIGTKAQQALKLQREVEKQARTARSRARQEAEAAMKFRLRQEKRREKHKGH